ncbi:TauD/TfdA dioxygenase family protein [Maribacter sp. R77961]|uniref:TauD/TfdA dioxygenase family protein n=1 Tax=Maribacter sp. R77961 TaxID=3093871 RepID=UPI0037CC69D8
MGFFNKKGTKIAPLVYKKLNPHIGIIVENLYDITKVSTSQNEELKSLVRKHSVVVIKGKRTWTEDEQKAFTNQLGKLELPVVYSIPPTQLKTQAIDTRIKRGSGVFWHSDNSYQESPSYLSVFQMVEIPLSGTKTSFASLMNLYKNLPKKDKLLWRDYGVVYRDTIVHPLLWKHPFNGRRTVYFDIGFSTDIRNHCDGGKLLPMKESNQIFNYINERLSNEESLIEHAWEEGDIIILDNYSVAHRADILMENEQRTLLRMTTEGVYF